VPVYVGGSVVATAGVVSTDPVSGVVFDVSSVLSGPDVISGPVSFTLRRIRKPRISATAVTTIATPLPIGALLAVLRELRPPKSLLIVAP